AFSRRIRALEAWLGVALFDRSQQPARLTEAGEWFRTTAEEVLARVARLPGEARAVADSSAATLRLAATHALSFTFLPGWLRGLEAHTPVGPVQLMSDLLQRCETLLLQNQVQLALCHAHTQAPGALDAAAFPWRQVGEDRLLPVSAPIGASSRPRHRLDAAQRGKPIPLLGYSAESGIGRILFAVHGSALHRLGVQTVFTAHLASVLKTMALDGRGIAWLPASLVSEELRLGKLVAAGDEHWAVALDIRLYRHPEPMSGTAEAIWTAAGQSADTGSTRRVSAGARSSR
ncbi:LysR substrate-binding domain-containing protein, partial [Hydrogenophaga sp.]|uniref:LysR substrate-binding domain-containing protein n=1 Tax=Hydrogenophaga sp. TaxID=1904254 RepID=UPI00356A59DF